MAAPAMLIRCLQKRKGGSNITMADNTVIAFRPDENDDHVALVKDPAHIQRLLSITEGYVIHTGPVADVEPVTDPVDKEPAPSQEPLPTGPLADMDDAALRAVFEAEVGRKPHHASKAETMIAQIEAIREENAK